MSHQVGGRLAQHDPPDSQLTGAGEVKFIILLQKKTGGTENRTRAGGKETKELTSRPQSGLDLTVTQPPKNAFLPRVLHLLHVLLFWSQ